MMKSTEQLNAPDPSTNHGVGLDADAEIEMAQEAEPNHISQSPAIAKRDVVFIPCLSSKYLPGSSSASTSDSSVPSAPSFNAVLNLSMVYAERFQTLGLVQMLTRSGQGVAQMFRLADDTEFDDDAQYLPSFWSPGFQATGRVQSGPETAQTISCHVDNNGNRGSSSASTSDSPVPSASSFYAALNFVRVYAERLQTSGLGLVLAQMLTRSGQGVAQMFRLALDGLEAIGTKEMTKLSFNILFGMTACLVAYFIYSNSGSSSADLGSSSAAQLSKPLFYSIAVANTVGFLASWVGIAIRNSLPRAGSILGGTGAVIAAASFFLVMSTFIPKI